MEKAAAKTGSGPMVAVAIEQNFPMDKRIIDDGLAYQILPFLMRAFVWLTRPIFIRDWVVRIIEKTAPGIWGGVMIRKRYIEDKLIESVNQIDAVVNLGAGFDTRVYRLQVLVNIQAWEADQSENIKSKCIRLRKLFGAMPAHVTLISIDFDHEDLDAVLASHGYSADMQTFFIMEAVTQYLTETGLGMIFNFLAKATTGSKLIFTYVLKDFIDGHNMYNQERLYKQYVIGNKAWIFGMDSENVASFLGKDGWHVVEHIGYEELAERYMKSIGRELTSTPIERMVYAEKQ